MMVTSSGESRKLESLSSFSQVSRELILLRKEIEELKKQLKEHCDKIGNHQIQI